MGEIFNKHPFERSFLSKVTIFFFYYKIKNVYIEMYLMKNKFK